MSVFPSRQRTLKRRRSKPMIMTHKTTHKTRPRRRGKEEQASHYDYQDSDTQEYSTGSEEESESEEGEEKEEETMYILTAETRRLRREHASFVKLIRALQVRKGRLMKMRMRLDLAEREQASQDSDTQEWPETGSEEETKSEVTIAYDEEGEPMEERGEMEVGGREGGEGGEEEQAADDDAAQDTHPRTPPARGLR